MLIIDAFAFCRHGEQQAGRFRLPELTRLRAECASDDGDVAWELVGKTDSVCGHCVLHLTINGTVKLICQRCLTPYVFKIQSEAKILLAKDESAADELEASLEDDEIEVIVGSKSFDVMALIEDEALLAIPLSPKHEVCPKKEMLDAFATAKKESPFAVLKNQLIAGKVKN